MSKRDPVWFAISKVLIWSGGTCLFFRFLMYLIAYIGGNIHEYWMPVGGASTLFIVWWGQKFLHWHLSGETENAHHAFPVLSTDVSNGNAMAISKDTTTMPDKPHIYIDKMMNVNHGTINQNTPGGMMNLGPVTVNQSLGIPQGTPESVEGEPKDAMAEVIEDDETIDIGGLIDFSEKLKPPGVARNTIDNILKKAKITPCKTEKDGRTIRNLYPRDKSQSAVAAYLADKDK